MLAAPVAEAPTGLGARSSSLLERSGLLSTRFGRTTGPPPSGISLDSGACEPDGSSSSRWGGRARRARPSKHKTTPARRPAACASRRSRSAPEFSPPGATSVRSQRATLPRIAAFPSPAACAARRPAPREGCAAATACARRGPTPRFQQHAARSRAKAIAHASTPPSAPASRARRRSTQAPQMAQRPAISDARPVCGHSR
jgi:hypothetical protein